MPTFEYYKEVYDRAIVENPYNWIKILKTVDGLVDFVMTATEDHPSETPFKDRVYAVFSQTSPVCKNGVRRSLKNVKDGWLYCGRNGSCACQNEGISTRVSKSKADKKMRIAKEAENLVVEDCTAELLEMMKSETLYDVHHSPRLMAWVNHCTKDIKREMPLIERIYLTIYGVEESICKRGNEKTFNTFDKGYRFCAPDCACRCEEQARKITEHQASLSPEEKQRRVNAQVDTMQTKYGVDNPMHVQDFKEKHEQIMLDLHGGKSAFESPSIQRSIKSENVLKYGSETPFGSSIIQQKARNTNIERYGVSNTMHIARAAFKEKTGFSNPFEMQEYQDKAKKSMIRDYGVAHALQVPEILKKMTENPLFGKYFSNTRGEVEIKDWLEGRGLVVQPQYQIPGHYHIYDMYVASLNLIIEFDGAHHWFEPYPLYKKGKGKHDWTDEEKQAALDKEVIRDCQNTKIALDNGYDIARILGKNGVDSDEHGSIEQQLIEQGFGFMFGLEEQNA